MRCIDIGCGGGAVSIEIARLAAPDGTVVGIDTGQVKLGLARQAAAERGVDDVETRPPKASMCSWTPTGGCWPPWPRSCHRPKTAPVFPGGGYPPPQVRLV
jgi:hypothetical protein